MGVRPLGFNSPEVGIIYPKKRDSKEKTRMLLLSLQIAELVAVLFSGSVDTHSLRCDDAQGLRNGGWVVNLWPR